MTSITLPSNATDPSQITSESAPTTRVNPSTGLPSGGEPLQIGDRWYKPSTGKEGFWNGSIFSSLAEKTISGVQRSGSASGEWRDMLVRTGGLDQKFIITQFILDYLQVVANYRFAAYLMPVGANTPFTTVFDQNLLIAGARTIIVATPNLVVDGGTQSQISTYMTRLDGTASAYNFNFNISYREIMQ